MTDGLDRKREWIAIGVAVASFLFSAGGFYFKVGHLEQEVERLKQELVRKDVLNVQLELIGQRMSNIEGGVARIEMRLTEKGP